MGQIQPVSFFHKQSFAETQFCPLVYIVYSCFTSTIEKLQNYDRDYMAHILPDITICLYGESLAILVWSSAVQLNQEWEKCFPHCSVRCSHMWQLSIWNVTCVTRSRARTFRAWRTATQSYCNRPIIFLQKKKHQGSWNEGSKCKQIEFWEVDR